MASPHLTPVLQIPHTYTAHAICQFELAHVLELRRQRETLDGLIAGAEAAIRAALEAGAEVQPGTFSAFLKVTERRSVAWKAVVERELGAEYAVRVLAATKPDKFSALVISA